MAECVDLKSYPRVNPFNMIWEACQVREGMRKGVGEIKSVTSVFHLAPPPAAYLSLMILKCLLDVPYNYEVKNITLVLRIQHSGELGCCWIFVCGMFSSRSRGQRLWEQSSLPHVRSCRDTQNLKECLQICVPACHVLVVNGCGFFQPLLIILLQGGKVIASFVSKVFFEAHEKKVSCRLREDISRYSLNIPSYSDWYPRYPREMWR